MFYFRFPENGAFIKIENRPNFKVTFKILTSACYWLSSETVKDTGMVSGAKCRPF